MKEFGERSTELESDEFDDTVADEGRSENRDADQPPAEEVEEEMAWRMNTSRNRK